MQLPEEQIYQIFLKWYAMPQESRKPQSIPEFCTTMEVDPSLIAQFTHKENFSDDLYKAAISWGKSKVPEMLHILYDRFSKSKSPNDLRMYKDILTMDKEKKSELTEAEKNAKGMLRELFDSTR
jgi:hypothetical protein